jgi:hypothetical protein
MQTCRSFVLAAFAAALGLGGCASGGSGSSVLPATATATVTEAGTLQPQSIVPFATLTITQNAPATIALVGTTTIPCAAEITSSDSRADYMVVASLPPARAGALPSGSIAVAAGDFTSTFAPVPTGFPLTLWRGARAQAQTHCVDVAITAPAGLANGTYSANIQYAVLSHVFLGLYATAATQTTTIAATVGRLPGR